MPRHKKATIATALSLALILPGCSGDSGIFGNKKKSPSEPDANTYTPEYDSPLRSAAAKRGDSVFDLFENQDDPNVTLRVNKYLWVAALDVLNFMPVEAADPFTGVISMGYGRPQGANRAYRATVYITDPALDARSLRVALQTNGGRAVSSETARAIENAILTRARQLRVEDTKL